MFFENGKNEGKRCELVVKNYPQSVKEDELRYLFQECGNIKRFKFDKTETFAFICFENPGDCSNAKQAFSGHNIDGRILVINHYDIKEQRPKLLEELIDKREWQRYTSEQSSKKSDSNDDGQN